MKQAMALGAAAVLLCGCTPANRFEVIDPDGAATAARLELCNRSSREVPRRKDRFEIRIPADCRGSGRIVVSLADGRTAVCPIRLVAEGLNAWYRYRLENGACGIR
jgi:hypothetical protein